MRNISSASLAKLAQTHGTEPVNILAVRWAEDGSKDTFYADRDIDGGFIKGKIIEVSDLDQILNVTGGSYSTDIQVTLDDADGSIKAILDSHDVHKRDCYLYQWFDGLDLSERFLIFQGQISSPVTWREGSRTVSFTIISKLEDREVGFSPEEGSFDSIPENLIGKAWPMVFGTALDVPAVALQEPVIGTITSGIGITDFNIVPRLGVLQAQMNGTQQVANVFRQEAERAEEEGDLLAASDFLSRRSTALFRFGELAAQHAELVFARNEQNSNQRSTVQILGSEEFPQNQTITLEIGGGLFTGFFQGDLFKIISRQHPKVGEIETPAVTIRIGTPPPWTGRTGLDFYEETERGELAGFFWANAGSRVRLSEGESLEYVASIVPGEVLKVSAHRNFEGLRRLVTVPPELYTVRTENYGSVPATIVHLEGPLSNRPDEGWDDELYVTFQSDVGPNTVDILEYLIDLYMPEFTTDTTSFNHVRSLVEDYPSDFALLTRRNVVQVLEEIAELARCALWISGNTFYIRYLPESPTPVTTITESDVEASSMELQHTPTEDLVTKLVFEWRESYAAETPNQVILKHNVKKYGTQEETRDCFIYNRKDLVVKSATFWLIRKANTWKRLRLQTPLHKLQVETLDAVTLGFTNNYVANSSVVAVAERASYNSESQLLDFEFWVPVKAGTMVPYDFAFPAGIDEELIFPTVEEEFSGYAGGDSPFKDASGPLIRVFRTLFPRAAGYRNRQEYGDPNPSDQGDVVPAAPRAIFTSANFDLTDPGLITPVQPLSEFNPLAGGFTGALTEIDIRTTIVRDSETGETTTFDTFFKKVEDETLYLAHDAKVADDEESAPIFLRYHEGSSQFIAGASFLLED